eukprot:774294_1
MQREEDDHDDQEMDLLSVDRAFAERIQIINQKTKQSPHDDRFNSSNNKYSLQTQTGQHHVTPNDNAAKTFLDAMCQFVLDNKKDVIALTNKLIEYLKRYEYDTDAAKHDLDLEGSNIQIIYKTNHMLNRSKSISIASNYHPYH